MYGNSGNVLGAAVRTTAASTTLAGAVVLPNTGGNTALHILSIASIILGILILVSFTITNFLVQRTKRT